ncbi:MAG TPA: hypothetical protein VFG30_01065 [Polyangiales bacterium]|nr:hypothetical protein [Polyangiales bacterium]
MIRSNDYARRLIVAVQSGLAAAAYFVLSIVELFLKLERENL